MGRGSTRGRLICILGHGRILDAWDGLKKYLQCFRDLIDVTEVGCVKSVCGRVRHTTYCAANIFRHKKLGHRAIKLELRCVGEVRANHDLNFWERERTLWVYVF